MEQNIGRFSEKNTSKTDKGDAGEHQQDAGNLQPGNALARGTEPAIVLHQHAEGQLTDEQSHGKDSDTDLRDEPGIAEHNDSAAQAS